jgi:hypothetical protein
VAAEIVLRRTKSPHREKAAVPLRDMILFVTAAGVPMVVFHLFYSYPSDRFFLPVVMGIAVIAGSLLGLLWGERGERAPGWAVGALVVLTAFARIAVSDPVPQRRAAADRIRANTPDDAMIISAIDPVFLEQRVARGSARWVVPLSREVEYARAVVRPGHARAPGGSRPRYIVQFVATERMDEIAGEARKGRAIFLDATALAEADNKAFSLLNSRFRMVRRAPALYELAPL